MIKQTLCLGLSVITLFAFAQESTPAPQKEIAPIYIAPTASPYFLDAVMPALHLVLARSAVAPATPPVSIPNVTQPIAATFMRSLTPAIPHLSPIVNQTVTAAPVVRRKNPEDTLVTLDSSNILLTDILHLLADQTGADMLLLSTDARLTVRIRNRRFIDALRDICAITGYGYLKVDKTYVIGPDEKLKSGYPDIYNRAHGSEKVEPVVKQPEEIVTDTYQTSYVDANKLVNSLKNVFTDSKLQIIAAPGQNIPALGQQNKDSSVGNETKVLDADKEAMMVSRRILVIGSRIDVERAMLMLRALDVAPAQVNVAVSITDVSNDALRDLGVEWEFGTIDTQFLPGKGISFSGVSRSAFDVTATLKALETAGKAKVLATPHLSILDGQRGDVLVGQRLTFPIAIGTNQNGGLLYSTQEERVGIYMQVAVMVINNHKVRLTLYPQVSTITGFISAGTAQYPQISTREAQTTLDMESGKTIVMAGLLDDEVTNNIRSVPLLSKIPFFGELFKSRHDERNRRQVIVTITPTLMPTSD